MKCLFDPNIQNRFKEKSDGKYNSTASNHEKILIPLKQKILTGIAIFCFIGFFILYILDLFAYGFAFYKDSNNVSFL